MQIIEFLKGDDADRMSEAERKYLAKQKMEEALRQAQRTQGKVIYHCVACVCMLCVLCVYVCYVWYVCPNVRIADDCTRRV